MMPPGLTLALNGAPVEWSELVGLRLDRHLSRPAALRVALDLPRIDAARPAAMGDRLTLTLKDALLFEGAIRRVGYTGEDGAVTLEFRAEDKLGALVDRRSAVALDVISLQRFAEILAGPVGLSLAPGAPDFRAGRHMNRFSNDLRFLTATLGRYGLAAIVKGAQLFLVDLISPRGAVRTLRALPVTHLRASERAMPDTAGWTGWCPESDDAVGASTADAGPGPQAVAVRAVEPVARLTKAAGVDAQARAAPLEATINGLHDIWPGDLLDVPMEGARQRLIGGVALTMDAADGPRTEIEGYRGNLVPGPAGTKLFAGQVESIADGDGAGRVCVGLPGLGGLRTGPLPVAGPFGRGAGGSGLAVPLSVGDPVALAAPDGDPELGIVLGGLARAGGVLTGLTEGETRTGLAWRGKGGAVQIDEAKGEIRLTLEDGVTVELAPGALRLSASETLDLDCSGTVRIRGSRIAFEEA